MFSNANLRYARRKADRARPPGKPFPRASQGYTVVLADRRAPNKDFQFLKVDLATGLGTLALTSWIPVFELTVRPAALRRLRASGNKSVICWRGRNGVKDETSFGALRFTANSSSLEGGRIEGTIRLGRAAGKCRASVFLESRGIDTRGRKLLRTAATGISATGAGYHASHIKKRIPKLSQPVISAGRSAASWYRCERESARSTNKVER